MTPETFNLRKFSHGILINCHTEHLYSYVGRADGFTKWFIGNAEYINGENKRSAENYIQAGDKFHWKWLEKDFELSGEILEVIDKISVTFSFGSLHEIKITVSERGHMAHLRLEQYYKKAAEPNDFVHINCAVCWVFFMTNLKSVIEHGIDLRETSSGDEELVNR
jgi:hypothetical protein